MFWYDNIYDIINVIILLIHFDVNPLLCFFLQHFSREMTKKCLYWNQKTIELIDDETGRSYYGEVHSAKWNKNIVKNEKFIGSGWYEFAKNKRLRRGDKLRFCIGYQPY